MSDDERDYHIDPDSLKHLGHESRLAPDGKIRWVHEHLTVVFSDQSKERKLFEARILSEIYGNDAEAFKNGCPKKEENGHVTYSFITMGRVFDPYMPITKAAEELQKGQTKVILDIANGYECQCHSRKNASQAIQ